MSSYRTKNVSDKYTNIILGTDVCIDLYKYTIQHIVYLL